MKPSIVQPKLNVLTEEQIEQVHIASLEILSRTGLRVDSQAARNVFASAEGTRLDDSLVRLQPELVEWAIQTAPTHVQVYNRLGQSSFCLGRKATRFGVGVTNLYYQDPLTDELAPFTRRHMQASVRLGSVLAGYDVVSTVGILRDIPAEQADLFATLEMATNTIKPLVLLVSDEALFLPTLQMLDSLVGDTSEKPFVLPYVNPISPLVLNAATADKMIHSIRRGLPVIYSNYGMAGTSTPITAAGTLVLLNAELLGGLVFSQLIKPGAPVILGSLPAYFDMRTMIDFYDPLSLLLNLACAEMMAHYHVPHAGTSGSGNGWSADLISSEALWMNHLTSCLGKVGLAPFVGGVLASKAFSPTLVVYSNEIIEQARRLAGGFELSDESMGLGEIETAGPGGNFLGAELTLKRFRTAYHTSQIFPRLSMEKWQEKGQPDAERFLREKTVDLIEKASPPDDHDELIAKGEAFIGRLRSEA